MLPLVSLCDFSPCDIPSWTTYTVCHALFTMYDPCFYCIMCTKRHADLYLGHEITSYLKVWSMIHFVHTALFDEVCLTFQQLQYNIWLDGSNSGLCAASGSVNRRKKKLNHLYQSIQEKLLLACQSHCCLLIQKAAPVALAHRCFSSCPRSMHIGVTIEHQTACVSIKAERHK